MEIKQYNIKNEIYYEVIHTREAKKAKKSCRFSGVIRKLMISATVLTALLGTTTGAFAAEPQKIDMSKVQTVAYENGISVETALQEIKTTISKLKLQVSGGFVQTETLEKLASQLSQLEKSANGKSTPEIVETISDVETTISGIKGNESVLVALQQVKDSLGISTTKARKSNAEGASFGDVKATDWYYNSVMEMAQQGLLQGTGATDENGEKLFDVKSSMTRAAYVTIAVRVAYGDELKNTVIEGGNWWDAAYAVAQNHGILSASDPDFMSNPSGEIRREEMALILQRTAHAKGVSTANLVYATQIPDFQDVKSYYREAVRECYTLGMLNGVDQIGTFNPQGTLDRASASQSFYKLLNADKRTPVSPVEPENPFKNPNTSQSGNAAYKPAAELQTWTEGETHTIPQAGDTVITKDGRTVVLTSTTIGGREFVGYGQGVDIVTGVTINGVTCGANGKLGAGYYNNDRTQFIKSKLTNEVYTKSQWTALRTNTFPEGQVGKEGDVVNVYWEWDTTYNDWHWIGEH